MPQLFCSRCRKTMNDTNFYQYRDGTKAELCKSCMTAHVNNWEPETFLWLLEKFDVPYIEEEWTKIRDAQYAKDPIKFGPMSVFGKYLAKMKLIQYKKYHWADTERIKAERDAHSKLYGNVNQKSAEELAQMKTMYENGEIPEAQYQTYLSMQTPVDEFVYNPDTKEIVRAGDASQYIDPRFPINESPFEQIDVPDPAKELTQEEKIYLVTKWGQLYTPADWITLETLYREYDESFDLHNADLISSTKQLCKLDLKCNQALDSGDIETYSKLSKALDSLRKSLKFTEAQRKENRASEFSCYGQIVAFAEKNNDEEYIRPISLDVERDIVDRDIKDMKNFTKQLIEEDPAIFKMIEQYIKKREQLAEMEQLGEDYELTDNDFVDYNEAIERQIDIDNDEEGEDYES